MSNIAIVTDSSVGLPPGLIEQYNIKVVPNSIVHRGRTYYDGLDLTIQDFYTLLRETNEIPTTAGVSTESFNAAFDELSREKDSILCILLSTGFKSVGWQSAHIAREAASNISVEIFDSRTIGGSMGLIVLAAAKAASQGCNMAEVLNVAEDVRSRINLIAALETLRYLAKGGRIGKAASWAGTLLNVKPILHVPVSSGIVEPLERVRTRQKAQERLVGIMEEKVGSRPVHVIVNHADVPQEAMNLRDKVASQFNCVETYIADWPPIVGVHTGPGLLGLSFYADS